MSSWSSGETLATPRGGRCLRQRETDEGLFSRTRSFGREPAHSGLSRPETKSPWPFFLALVGAQLKALVFEINSDLEKGGPVAIVPVS